jgi:hypothetical protein
VTLMERTTIRRGSNMLAKTLTPTAEQSAIIDAAKSTKDSILISALAGAAKTSPLWR